MQIQYSQDNDKGKVLRSYGFKLWDRADQFPLNRLADNIDSLKRLNDTSAYNAGIIKLKAAGALGTERLFLGKNRDGETGLFLRDDKGIPRLRIFINRENEPVIQTLNNKGEVVASR